MRVVAVSVVLASTGWTQFQSTTPLVVAPTTVIDSKGRYVDGLTSRDLILYDNNVPQATQMDWMAYPISLVVAIQTSSNSGAVIDKLGGSGILFTQLLAAEAGETALISFSEEVKVRQEFTSNSDQVTYSLRMLRKDGSDARILDAMRQALLMLERRPAGRRRIILMIAEKRDRSSAAKLPEVVAQAQRLNVAVYWLTYSPFLEPFTVRPKTAEDLKPEAERIKIRECALCPGPDDTSVPTDLGPGGWIYAIRELARLHQPVWPVLEELIRQAAQGSVMHNDDTGMRILRLAREPGDKRTGTFTSGIVSMVGAWTVALFFTGWKLAGENLAEVLKQRARELPAPIQMSDALSRNSPKVEGVEPLQANCLAHGRRQIVEVADNFPEECRYVLETLRDVYHHDALAREQEFSPEDRLRFHQEHSGPLMKGLHEWMEAQLGEHKTEPNSGLGKAISYLLNHWTKLTLFLRQPGAPIDNNIVERALKKAILNRKNALFYMTLNGAGVGDLFMSLIHTCELNGANPFDYLTQLQRHTAELKRQPSEWMPWNNRDTLARLALPAAA